MIRSGQSLAGQAITGGSIDGTPIGATTPSSGAFTTLSATGIATFTGGMRWGVRVVVAAGVVTLTNADVVVVVNKTVGAATVVNLPAGVTNQVFVIKDGKGDANSNNITVTPAAGNIDGAGTLVMTVNYQSVMLIFNGSQWNIL